MTVNNFDGSPPEPLGRMVGVQCMDPGNLCAAHTIAHAKDFKWDWNLKQVVSQRQRQLRPILETLTRPTSGRQPGGERTCALCAKFA